MRASFDFHELTIIVVNENDPTSLYDLHVRVLNCDTISQVSFVPYTFPVTGKCCR